MYRELSVWGYNTKIAYFTDFLRLEISAIMTWLAFYFEREISNLISSRNGGNIRLL